MRTPSARAALAAALMAGLAGPRAGAWPDMGAPAPAVGGGEFDSAAVVAVEDYPYLPPLMGAGRNGEAWRDYFVHTRGVPPRRVSLVRDTDATMAGIMKAAAAAASRAGPSGALWFVFIGYGVPGEDGRDARLTGADARPGADGLRSRSLPLQELWATLGRGGAAAVHVVIDAGLGGATPDGSPLAPGLAPLAGPLAGPPDKRFTILFAAQPNQAAGTLPGGGRPAFSYLVLGGLRGWADADANRRVEAGEVLRFASQSLETARPARRQDPVLIGKTHAILGRSGREAAPSPDGTGGAEPLRPAEQFQPTLLPAVPYAPAPAELEAEPFSAQGLGLGAKGLAAHRAASALDASDAPPEQKARAWRELGARFPGAAAKAGERALAWEAQARNLRRAQEAQDARLLAREADWKRLSAMLALPGREAAKRRWALAFLQAYGDSLRDDPHAADLAPYLPAGVGERPGSLIEWVFVPGIDAAAGSTGPAPAGAVPPSFQMARTEVTFGQYRQCVAAGACGPAHDSDGLCRVRRGGGWDKGALPAAQRADGMPAVCVGRRQAEAFSAWAGGRLPSGREWAHAFRSAGKPWDYPWGNVPANCDRAVMDDGGPGCGRGGAWPPCSRLAGNSEQGLCDMAGNAAEWTAEPGASRGGAWFGDAEAVRADARAQEAEDEPREGLGFRPVRDAR